MEIEICAGSLTLLNIPSEASIIKLFGPNSWSQNIELCNDYSNPQCSTTETVQIVDGVYHLQVITEKGDDCIMPNIKVDSSQLGDCDTNCCTVEPIVIEKCPDIQHNMELEICDGSISFLNVPEEMKLIKVFGPNTWSQSIEVCNEYSSDECLDVETVSLTEGIYHFQFFFDKTVCVVPNVRISFDAVRGCDGGKGGEGGQAQVGKQKRFEGSTLNTISEFKFYPNPASDLITVQLESFHDFKNLKLINLMGQTLSAYTIGENETCLLYTSPSPRDQRGSRMPSSA